MQTLRFSVQQYMSKNDWWRERAAFYFENEAEEYVAKVLENNKSPYPRKLRVVSKEMDV